MKTTDYWTNDKDGYLDRNKHLSRRGLLDFFTETLEKVGWREIKSVCEYGCNVGLNLKVMHEFFPTADIRGFDLNPEAVKIANEIDGVTARVGNFLISSIDKYSLVITKGLLIHIHPADIQQAYENLYNMTDKYLLLCEYYNPTPVEVEYHNKMGLLFKRDFAGDMLDMYHDLKLVSYGFRYHLDDYAQDDISWFLIKKENK